MKLEDLVGRRVRIHLHIARRDEKPRKHRGIEPRFCEGVVERHPLFDFVIPAPDGRLPFVVDETRVLDVEVERRWGLDGDEIRLDWEPVFDGRPPKQFDAR
jgi:hypothetical protein